jgi:hypothetical protein
MITRQQYLDALETIDLYHRQNQEQGLTLIQDWDKLQECSVRLYKVLFAIMGEYQKQYTEKYIEKIDPKKMKLVLNCGKKSIDEFIELRGY